MREIIEGVYLLSGFPEYLVNCYLVGDVLIDAGIRSDEQRILKALKNHQVRIHALTHVHADHQGASHAVCEALKIPLWCPEAEVAAMETGDMNQQIPVNLITRFQKQFWLGPAHPVAKGLREGDQVGDFVVIETPGHSPGHVSFWRERDRVLIAGDTARNVSFLTLQTGLGEPPAVFTMDAERNRQSMRKLAALNPRVILFGHGKPVLDGTKFVDFVQGIG